MHLPYFEKIKVLFKKAAQEPRRNPNHDWIVILYSFMILFVIVVLGAAYLFYGIERGILFREPSDIVVQPQSVDKNAINTVSSYYQNKEAELEAIRNTKTSDLVDPAL